MSNFIGETLQIGIFNFFKEDEQRAKMARHQRLTLASQFILAGGKFITFVDVTKKPIMVQSCNLATSGDLRGQFWCQGWRVPTKDEM